jgi:hypothetical protein
MEDAEKIRGGFRVFRVSSSFAGGLMADKPGVMAVVDRVEGKLAVISLGEDEEVQFELPLKYLPAGTVEGDHLRIRFEPAPESRERARKRVEELKEELTKGQDTGQKRFKL